MLQQYNYKIFPQLNRIKTIDIIFNNIFSKNIIHCIKIIKDKYRDIKIIVVRNQ